MRLAELGSVGEMAWDSCVSTETGGSSCFCFTPNSQDAGLIGWGLINRCSLPKAHFQIKSFLGVLVSWV